jgi:transcriptional regulator with XRE-family HTH domain
MNTHRFGNEIMQLRVNLGIKRKELAQKLQISYGHLNNIELGNRMPSIEVIIALATHLQVASGYLFQQLVDESPYQQLVDKSPFQQPFDPNKYLVFPDSLTQEAKAEIREFVAFKERREKGRKEINPGVFRLMMKI